MKFPAPAITLFFLLFLVSVDQNPVSANTTNTFNTLHGSRKGVNTRGLHKLKKYFQHFGYLNTSYDDFSDDFDDFLESAVKNYQLNFNLNQTGELDGPTIKHIMLPRCGNADVVNGTSTMRSGKHSNSSMHTAAHYSFFSGQPRWPSWKSRLTYAFLPENHLTDAVKSMIARAFQRWSEVTPLTFVEVEEALYNQADLTIGFYVGEHGDDRPFDGVLRMLAHAFSPPNGSLHFDGDETWAIDGNFVDASSVAAVDLESVAVHEIGHLLGLGHSSLEDSIMYPTISSGIRKVDLANDDITGIQVLYGSNPEYTGSDPLTPTGERNTNRAPTDNHVWRRGVLFALGLVSLLLLS